MAAQAPAQDHLSLPLTHPPRSLEMQCVIFNALFIKAHTIEEYTTDIAWSLKPYFHYYGWQCGGLEREPATSATHRHVIRTVGYLRTDQNTKEAIRHRLKAAPNELSDKTIRILIPLAARLWLMVGIGSVGPLVFAGQRTIAWEDDKCMKDIIKEEFSREHEIEGTVELPKTFNAVNVEQRAGITIAWTSNLADHLLLKEEDGTDGGPKVYIFHHASFLRHYQESER
jgi:hypothetical protein